MPETSPPRSRTVGEVLRAGLPAGVLAVLVSVGLRTTTLPAGARVVTSFGVFVLVYTILYRRITGLARTPIQWALTVAVWIVAGFAMWVVAERW